MGNHFSRRPRAEYEEQRKRRRDREAAAGRLLRFAPDLLSLDLRVDEVQAGGSFDDVHYIRRVVVGSAPALFECPCSLAGCKDGGYDLTREILEALAAHRREFRGEQVCGAWNRAAGCGRILRYVATATYARAAEHEVRG